MTHSPPPESPNPEPSSGPPPNSPQNQRKRRRTRRISLGLAAGAVVGITAGGVWVLNFVRNDLVPLLDQNLSDTINRPIQLGPVEGFSFSSITLGRSRLPPVEADPNEPDRRPDRDEAIVEQIVVRFNPLEVLVNRRLGLDITLVRPTVFLDENAEGRWIETELDQDDQQPGFIKTEVEWIRVEQGTLTLAPSPDRRREVLGTEASGPLDPQVRLLNVNALVGVFDDNQRFEFEVSSTPELGGTLRVAGESRPGPGDTNLTIQAEKLPASLLTNLVAVPLTADAGLVFANMGLQFRDNVLEGITGTARVQQATARIVGVPGPVRGINSQLRFQGKLITLEDTGIAYGQVPTRIEGTIHLENGYNLTAQLRSVTVDALQQTFQVNLPIPVVGAFNTDARITGPLDDPRVAATIENSRPTRIDRVLFDDLRAELRFQNQTLFFDDLTAAATLGGSLQGSGQVRLGDQQQIDLNVRVEDLPGDAIANLYNANLGTIRLGTIGATVALAGPLQNPETTIRWQAAGGTYPAEGTLAIAGNRLRIQDTVVQLPGGQIQGEGELVGDRWQASVQGTGIALGRFSDSLTGTVDGSVQASGRLNAGVNAITADGQAVARIAGGTINAQGELTGGRWRLNLQSSGVQLGQFSNQLTGTLNGTAQASGRLGEGANAIAATAEVNTRIAGGTLNAQGELMGDRWQLSLQSSGVQLGQFSNQLTGTLDGTVQASGRLGNLRPNAIAATGQVNLSQVPVLNRPLSLAFRWTGDRLIIDNAIAQGFRASGFLIPQLQGPGAPTLQSFNFIVNARDFDLASLPVDLPPQVRLQGLAGFNGQVFGTLATPQVVGQLQLAGLVVNDLAFEPLAGPVQFAQGRGFSVDLQGEQDRILARVDGNNRPQQIQVRQAEVFAQAETVGDRLTATLRNFPLAVLNLSPGEDLGLGSVTGLATGNFNYNWNTQAASGDLAIARPGIGYIQTEGCLITDFSATRTGAEIETSELRLTPRAQVTNPTLNLCTALFDGSLTPTSRFRLSGNATLGDAPQFKGEVVVDEASLQDVLSTLQWFQLSDLGRFGDPNYSDPTVLNVLPVGDLNASLIDQLRRYSEILALLQQQADQQAREERLPPLRDLQGVFTGTIDIAASETAGIELDFNLSGQDWRWGTYRAEQFVARGEFNNGALTLLPLRLETGDAFISLTGTLGGEQQAGQLEARNLPLDELQNLLRLPLELDGTLDALATLEGSVGNPSARGAITLNNATLNGTPVESANASFSFLDARLRFISRLLVEQATEPMQVVGSIPYQFPFMTVSPDSDAISLQLNVQDEGLAVISLFTDQVVWEGGNGEVDVAVSGTAIAPQLVGTARLENATFSSPALPEPLTNVNGDILFNVREINVRSLSGQFRQGQVIAQGILPVFGEPLRLNELGEDQRPLTVTLDEVVLNFPGLYRGSVEGNVIVGGTALALQLGGDLTLSNGRVELPSGPPPVAAAPPPGTITTAFTPPRFSNLQVTLGQRLQVTLQPILNFVATGDLTINGPFVALRPNGVIRLRSGQVNLFTTQFNLARGYENTATFQPELGLDPILNVRLATTVAEVTRAPTQLNTALFPSAEIVEPLATDFGILNTVRVRAEVEGPASQVFDNLSLTSSPPRSNNEIIALLGGGFVSTLGRGDTTLAIANLASSALLTGVQNLISNAFGLTDFRLYPTGISASEGNTTLGLAAELGFDLSNNLSVSVLQIITAESPTQFNLRYRLTDELNVRGFVDTNGGNGFLVEFETRF